MNRFLLLLFIVIFIPVSVRAEDSKLPVGAVENTKMDVKDEYIEPSFQNLSKMYWAIGKLDIKDDDAIDNYLLINECDLYLQYYNNDFAWQNIREVTRDHILKSMGQISTKFELLAPIILGRYDVENEEFGVERDSQLMAVRNIDFNSDDYGYNFTCTEAGEIKDYPLNLIVILNRPLTLEKVPVKKELAELYLNETQIPYDSLSKQERISKYKRTAYIRLKIRITQYKGTTVGPSGSLKAVVFGNLEGYEVYADSAKLKPLYSVHIKNKSSRRHLDRERKDEDSEGQEEKEDASQE